MNGTDKNKSTRNRGTRDAREERGGEGRRKEREIECSIFSIPFEREHALSAQKSAVSG